MSGWISIDRATIKHWVSSEPNILAVWIRLLLEANFSDNKAIINSNVIIVKRGQLIYGRKAFAKRSKITENKLRRIMGMLEKDLMINQQKLSKYTIITITNYDLYQSNHQQTTSKPPANHQQATTLKQGNKDNKDNNSIMFADEFNHFWVVFKKQEGRKDATKAWNEIEGMDNSLVDKIIQGAKNYNGNRKQMNGHAPGHMMPANWLAGERWNDKFIKPAGSLSETNDIDWDAERVKKL